MQSRRAFLRTCSASLMMFGAAITPRFGWAMPDPEIAGFIRTPAGKLWYRINGARHLDSAKVPLLCLHGGPGATHRSLINLVGLAKDRAIILYDQLDCGHSERPNDPKNWTLDRLVSEIQSVKSALGLERIALLGHSMGGAIAAVYAVARPAGLEALILASPLISTSRWVSDNAIYREQLPVRTQEILDKHERNGTTSNPDYIAATQRFYDRHLCIAPCPIGDLRNDAPDFNRELYEYMWGPSEFAATGTLGEFDLTGRIHRIQAPTLFICGDVDEATPASCREFAALVPNGQFELIEDSAHQIFIEQPDDVLISVQRFLTSAGL